MEKGVCENKDKKDKDGRPLCRAPHLTKKEYDEKVKEKAARVKEKAVERPRAKAEAIRRAADVRKVKEKEIPSEDSIRTVKL